MSDKPENTPENAPAALEGAIGEIEHGPSAFEQFLDKNQKKLMIGGVALIVALVGYVVWDGLSKKAEKDAAAAVSSANDVTELRAAAEEHSGTNAAGAALFKIAQRQWADQQQDEAIATLEDFTSKYASHRLFYNAKAVLGSFHLQLGEAEKAKTAFQEVVDSGSQGHELYGLALLNLGDIALSEKEDEAAKEFYERIGNDLANRAAPGIKKIATERLELVGVSAPAAKEVEPPKPAVPVTPATGSVPTTPAIPADPAPANPPGPVVPPEVAPTGVPKTE